MFGRTKQHRGNQAFGKLARQITEHLIARRFHVTEQLFHQFVVMIGKFFEHRETLGLFHIGKFGRNIDHLALFMLLIDKGTFQREIDKTCNDLVAVGSESGAAPAALNWQAATSPARRAVMNRICPPC